MGNTAMWMSCNPTIPILFGIQVKIFPLNQILNHIHPARYAVTFENNVDSKLRRHWVAGATIRIIDRQTDEVIAKKTIYVFEKGLDGTGGARMPWKFAILCNKERLTSSEPLSDFVLSVLKPETFAKSPKIP